MITGLKGVGILRETKGEPMTKSPTITYKPTPYPDEVATVRAGLLAYNRRHAPDVPFSRLPCFPMIPKGPSSVAYLAALVELVVCRAPVAQ